jgi:hypothetical protein
VNGAGYLTGLSMLIDPRLEDYYAALFSFYGVQVLVHANQDYPEISARGILLSPRKEAFLQASHLATSCCLLNTDTMQSGTHLPKFSSNLLLPSSG